MIVFECRSGFGSALLRGGYAKSTQSARRPISISSCFPYVGLFVSICSSYATSPECTPPGQLPVMSHEHKTTKNVSLVPESSILKHLRTELNLSLSHQQSYIRALNGAFTNNIKYPMIRAFGQSGESVFSVAFGRWFLVDLSVTRGFVEYVRGDCLVCGLGHFQCQTLGVCPTSALSAVCKLDL